MASGHGWPEILMQLMQGVQVLSMHAPFEVVSKFDCYMTTKL